MVNKSWPRAVVVRNKRFLGVAMRVDKANKSTLTAVIYDRLKSRAISDQATGGTRKARGRNLAIPSTFVEGKRGRRGVPKALRPRTQLGRKRTFVAKDANSGQLMILRRKGRGRYPLQVLYVLENTAHIPKRWRPEEDAIITLRRDFARHFVKRWRQAMRTRR
ncbi:MAG: hypothetical protein TEF_11685 [Rhizobiales bacterium NRL2]|jgi:hypothetical protein|nr:MAG: hypothetical protein TEF_11685 [Rhizobiales bacterium NRL2]